MTEVTVSTGLTPDDIAALEAPLPFEHHEARAAGKNKAGDKQQWLIYITQEGIIPRLNTVDPNWAWEVRESRETTRYAVVTGRLTIKGVSRDSTGGGSPNGDKAPMSEDTEKGAETDALKRAAMRFGVGLYLRSQPMIWVPITDKSWEDERTALAEFAKWYQREFGRESQPATPPTPPPLPAVPGATVTPPPPSPASTAPTSASGGSPDDAPPNLYTVTEMKVVPQGNSHMYLLKAGKVNITLFGGDLLRKAGVDVEAWKRDMGKWFPLKPALRVTADADGDKWIVISIEKS